MNDQHEPEFDRYAQSYSDMHKQSVRTSGEEPGYFSAYKAAYMAGSLGSHHDLAFDLLDFGCGIGGSVPHLRGNFPHARILGMDVSGQSVDMAGAANPDARFRKIEGGKLDLEDDSIDVSMVACVYHHIAPSERLGWTRELQRVIRPGGRLFLFEHNPLNPLTRKIVRDCPFDEDAILLPHKETLDLFRQAGFKEVKLDYIVFFPKFLGFLRPLERRLSGIPLGAQYVVHGVA